MRSDVGMSENIVCGQGHGKGRGRHEGNIVMRTAAAGRVFFWM